MAGNSDGFPDQHAIGSFIHDANRLHAINGQSSSVSNQWENEFHPPPSYNQSVRLHNECGASSNYYPRLSNMQRPRYFVHQNPPIYYSQRFPPWISRFQLGQQNQQISAFPSRFQASAPSDHCGTNVGSSVQATSAVASQQYGSSQTNSHTMRVGRSVQILPGHLQQQYGSSSATLTAPPDPTEHTTIHSQRPQETFLPGYHQQQNDSPNTDSGVLPATSENSINAPRPQQTFLPGNQQQQNNPPNTSLGSHPAHSEHSSAHAQRPQQTFMPGNSQQHSTSSSTVSGVHLSPFENNIQAQRPQQTFLQGIEHQYYSSSNTGSPVHPATSEQNVAHAQRPQQTFISGNSLQHYTSSNTGSIVHPAPSENSIPGISIQAQRPQQTFISGNSLQHYTSSNTGSIVHPAPSENSIPGISIQAQRPQQTFISGNSLQHYTSSNTGSIVHPAPSENSIPGISIQAQRPQQTFISGNSLQHYTSSNTGSIVHPAPSENSMPGISIQAQRPQQTFISGNSLQHYTSSNTGSIVHPAPSENSIVYAPRPQQTFVPGNSQQHYASSNTGSPVHPAPSENRIRGSSILVQRLLHTVVSDNPQQQYRSSNTISDAHLTPSSQTDNLLSGIQPQTYSYLTGKLFKDNTKTTSVNYSVSSIAAPTSSAVHQTTMSLHQQDKEHQSIDRLNEFRIVKNTGSAAYYEMPCTSQVHDSCHINPAVNYTPSLQQHSQVPVQQHYLNNLHGVSSSHHSVGTSLLKQGLGSKIYNLVPARLQRKRGRPRKCVHDINKVITSDIASVNIGNSNSHGLHSSSYQSVGASLPKQGLGRKINNLVSARLQRKRGRPRKCVHDINEGNTPDKANVNIGNPNSLSLGSVNEYQSGETEPRARYGHCNMEQELASTDTSVNKPRWYKYPDTAVVPSFQSDIEAMQTDLSNYTTSSATARFSIGDPASGNEPSLGVCTDIQITDNQISSVGATHRDIKSSRSGNTPETGYQDVIENRSEKQLTAPIKQEAPDHLSVPEVNSSVEITVNSINDLSQSGVSIKSDMPQPVEVDTSQELSRCINSSTPSDVSPTNSSSIDRAVHCSNTLENSEVIPHMHAANDQLVPSPIVDSGLMKDGDLTSMNNLDKVSEPGVLNQNTVQISGNDVKSSGVTLEEDMNVVAKHQHCIFQALKPIYESRVNKNSESKLALLPGRLQNRRQTCPYLGKNSNEACKSNAARLSTSRLSLDCSTLGQSKLQSTMRNADAQTMCYQRKCVTSNLTDSKLGRSLKSGDQKQPSSCENSLSAKEKVYNMWKVGHIIKDKRTGKKIQRKESAKVTRIMNHSEQTAKSQQAIKSLNLKAAATKDLVVRKTSADKTMNKVKQKVATGKTALIKANNSKISKIQKPASTICNVIIHGHKLLCFKSKTEDLILLSEFQFTCFPGKTVGSLNNCIDHILRIKKGVLEHPEKDRILTFLKKQDYHMGSLIHTISVNDGRKIYHHLYGIETCTTTMCVVEIPDAVSLDDLFLTKSTLKSSKEVHSLEENKANKSPVTIGVVEGQEVSAIETRQSDRDSPNRQGSDVSRKFRQSVDVATVISDSDETWAYGDSSDFGDDEFESVLNNPFVIRWLPCTPKIGYIINKSTGNIRSYIHNGDSYLAVDDLCKTKSICDRIQKGNVMLYSCCKEIESCLNKMDSNFLPLKSRHQSLVKETDIVVHEVEDNACHNSGHHKSSIFKRVQGDYNENNIPHKHPRLAEDALLTDAHNLTILKFDPSVVRQDSNSQSDISLGKVRNPSESCPDSMLKRTEVTGLTTEDAHSENPPRENSQITAITKSISHLTPCLDKENGLTSSGDHLTVEKRVNNSKKLLQHPETEMIYITYIPTDITSSMDTDSCCRITDSIFDQSVIRQHDLLSPDSERSTFSPDESLINSGKLILNHGSWNSHERHLLLVCCEELNTISKDTHDRCLTSQVQTMSVKYSGEHDVEKADNNSCQMETTDITVTTNTPSERNASHDYFDNIVVAQTEPQTSLGDNENMSSQRANKQNDLSATEKLSFESFFCLGSLIKDDSGEHELKKADSNSCNLETGRTVTTNTPSERNTSYDHFDNNVATQTEPQTSPGDYEDISSQSSNEQNDSSAAMKSSFESFFCSGSLIKDYSGEHEVKKADSNSSNLETTDRTVTTNTPSERNDSHDHFDNIVAAQTDVQIPLGDYENISSQSANEQNDSSAAMKSSFESFFCSGSLIKDYSGEHEVKKAGSNLETTDRTVTTNTPSERNDSHDHFDNIVAAQTDVQIPLGDYENISSQQSANEQNDSSATMKSSFESFFCSGSLIKDDSGAHEVKKADSNSCNLETTDRTITTNTPSERNDSHDRFDDIVEAQTEPQTLLGNYENSSQSANEKNDFSATKKSSFESFFCSGSLTKDNSGRDNMSVSYNVNTDADFSSTLQVHIIEDNTYTVNTDAGFSSTLQVHSTEDDTYTVNTDAGFPSTLQVHSTEDDTYTVNTDAGFSSTLQVHLIEDDSPGYDIILHANQNEIISDIANDNSYFVVNSTSDTHTRDSDKMVSNTIIIDDEDSNHDEEGTEKTAGACGKLSSEHEVMQQSSLLAGLALDVDTGADYLLPSFEQSLRSRRCVDDMDIITRSSTSMLVLASYRQAYAKLLQQYKAVLDEKTKLTKKCKSYEDLIQDMVAKYKWGPT